MVTDEDDMLMPCIDGGTFKLIKYILLRPGQEPGPQQLGARPGF